MPKINSLEVVHQDTNKDSYQNLHDILVDLNKSLALNKEVVDEDARASIENLLEMYVNDKEAFLRSLQTLTAQFKNSEAIYTEEILLLASQLEAQAKRVTSLTAQTENNIASVREYSEVVASEVDRKVSTYSQDDPPTTNLAYGDLWYDTNDNKKLYRWNGVAWIATDDTRIATTYARWGVEVDANGNVAGIQLNSDNTGTSEFTVVADNFRVYKSGYTSNPMFSVGSVNGTATVSINGNLILDGTVITRNVGSNAIGVAAGNVVGGTSATQSSVSFTIAGLGTSETVPVLISTGVVAAVNCNMATYINTTQLALDTYTAGQLSYIGSIAALGNGTYTAALDTNITGSGSRRLSILVQVIKR